MSLQNLPLVLFRDIIELIVLDEPYGAPFCELFDLRLVNRLFEAEVTKYFARHRLEGCRNPNDRAVPCKPRYSRDPDVPREFVIRMLQDYVGEEDRRQSYFLNWLHSVVDELMEQLKKTGKPVERSYVLRDACEAIHLSGYSRKLFRGLPSASVIPSDHKPDRQDVLNGACLVAIMMRYTEVEKSMLTGEVAADDEVVYFGFPLWQAVRLGYCVTAERLIREGGLVNNSLFFRKFPHALMKAAKEGHTEVIEMVLRHTNDTIQWTIIAANAAAKYQRWELVLILLEKYGEDIPEGHLKNLLCWAAQHGADEIILEIIKYNVWPRNVRLPGCKRYPLREAVRHGHVSTVKLLLDNGALGDEIESHTNILAQYVVMSGNFEMFQLLREYYFWNPQVEWVFLPTGKLLLPKLFSSRNLELHEIHANSAEFGHLDFAKYAVESPTDPRKNPLNLVDGELRDFSVLRAVVAGHLHVVRWFVEEVGVNLNDVGWSNGEREELKPLVLAVDSGNVDMVRLLTKQLNVELLGEEYTGGEFDFREREGRKRNLEQWKRDLNLGKHFTKLYHAVPQRSVDTALQVGKGLSS